MPQWIILTWVKIQTSFILKGERMWSVAANFLVPESFILVVVTQFWSWRSFKTQQDKCIPHSLTFYLSLSIKDISFIPLKVETEPWEWTIMYDKGAEPAWPSISHRVWTLDLKEQTQYGARFGLLWYISVLNPITLLSMFLNPFFSALNLFFPLFSVATLLS